MTTAVRGLNYVLSLLGIMIVTSAEVMAALSGQLETTYETNNRHFQIESSLEEQLDLNYENPEQGLSSGLSLALSQQKNDSEAELYQLYLQQDLNNALDQISLGRFFRADTLGYYSLDGVQYRHKTKPLIISIYAGKPARIEAFRSIDGDALYGLDLQTQSHTVFDYKVDARLGVQRLEQNGHEQRYHFGLRANSENENKNPLPATLSMSASYVAENKQWESAQINTRWDLEKNSTLRIDYETYEPVSNEMSFRDRFYSLYARGSQTQFKAAYQFEYDYQQTWTMAARRVDREFGGQGYAGMFAVEHRSNQGLWLVAKTEQLELQTERVTSLFIDADKTLSPSLRGGISSVVQEQEKQLVGNNRSLGIEFRLQQMLSVRAMPSNLQFSTTASHIWNSRLDDEYRFMLSLSYKFGDAKQAPMQ